MRSRQCPFCENVNPPKAKFCNACGLKLHAALCPYCGAVNALTATSCIKCAEVLETPGAAEAAAPAESAADRPLEAGSTALAQPAAEPEAHTSAPAVEEDKPVFSVHFGRDHAATIDRYDLASVRPGLPPQTAADHQTLPTLTNFVAESPGTALNGWSPQVSAAHAYSVAPKHDAPGTSAVAAVSRPVRRAVWIAGIVLVMFAGSTFFLHREHSKAISIGLISAGGGPSDATQPSGADAAAPEPAPAPDANIERPATAAVPTAQAPRPTGANLSGDRPEPIRPPIASREAAAAVAAAAARPKQAAAGGARRPQRLEPCTDAVAALGLCAAPTATPGRQ